MEVWFSRNAKDRRLVDKKAKLILDNSTATLTVKNHAHPLKVSFNNIQKVVFDVSTHMSGHVFLGTLAAGVVGGVLEAKRHVSDYWCYIAYTGPRGSTLPYLIQFHKNVSLNAIDQFKAALGNKVTVTNFPQQSKPIDKHTLTDLQSKDAVKVDKKHHPLPSLKPDKALLVVVCPPLSIKDEGTGPQYKLHPNNHVIAVNKMGTYTFAYLDPGKYTLVSQSGNAGGFRMKLQADKAYYFFQDTFMGGWKPYTALSRHSKGLVMYEVKGAYYSDWKPK